MPCVHEHLTHVENTDLGLMTMQSTYPHVRYPTEKQSLNKGRVINRSCSLNKLGLTKALFLMWVPYNLVSTLLNTTAKNFPLLPRSAALQTIEAQAQMLACERGWVMAVRYFW